MRPAWSTQFDELGTVFSGLPFAITREWAWGGSTGAGVKVAVIDSGIEADHPLVGGIAGGVAIVPDPGAENGVRVLPGETDDLFGHGTACAAIIRHLAPDSELYSVRVLGERLKGRGVVFEAGIRWAIENGMRVVNLSLSTGRADYYGSLHALADEANFANVVLVCAANNVPGPSYPSLFSSVISVAAHLGQDPEHFVYNSAPPVDFGAPGIGLEVAWRGGKSVKATGNSFAAPHISGLVARILGKHPRLTPFQLKTVLVALADNSGGEP